jgi:hypothetical protein
MKRLDFPTALANGVHSSDRAGLKRVDGEHFLCVSETLGVKSCIIMPNEKHEEKRVYKRSKKR